MFARPLAAEDVDEFLSTLAVPQPAPPLPRVDTLG
jgi:hypothetical protein